MGAQDKDWVSSVAKMPFTLLAQDHLMQNCCQDIFHSACQ